MSGSPRPSSPIGFYEFSHATHSPTLDASWPQLSSQEDTDVSWLPLFPQENTYDSSYIPFVDPMNIRTEDLPHMPLLTSQSEPPEKFWPCPIATCPYHLKGFVRKYDTDRHTLSHYKGTIVCGFCSGSGSNVEKSFKRADVFKRHLQYIHGAESLSRNNRKRSRRGRKIKKATQKNLEGSCSTCSVAFSAQALYEHLDDCLLQYIRETDPYYIRQTDLKDSPSSLAADVPNGLEPLLDASAAARPILPIPRPLQNTPWTEGPRATLWDTLNPSKILSSGSFDYPHKLKSSSLEKKRKRSISVASCEEMPPPKSPLPLSSRSSKLLEPLRPTEVESSPANKEIMPVTNAKTHLTVNAQYISLNLKSKEEIRVLSVIEPQGHQYRLLSINYAQSNPPPYVALSYAWGKHDIAVDIYPPNRIWINDQPYDIRPNLYAFLTQWGPTLHMKSLPLWVDAVCIDQDNLEERESQVAQMREIFTKAKAVWAWLGPSNHASGTAGVFEKLYEWIARFREPAEDARYSPDSLANYGAPSAPSTKFFWSGLTQMITRTWWMRAWIVQEVTCNPSTFLLNGPTCMKYHAWRESILAMNKSIVLKSKILPAHWDAFREHFNAAITLLNLGERLAQSRSADKPPASALLETLEMMSHTKCSDPRDKVYAILGLTPDLVRSMILPDYKIATQNLWLHVARFFCSYMPDGHKLEFLRDLPNARQRRSLLGTRTSDKPSWIVDWAAVNSEQSQYFSQYRGNRRYYNPDYWNYTNPLIEDSRLIIRGACIGRVNEVLPSWMAQGHVAPAELRDVCQSIASTSKPYPTKEPMADVVDRTIIMDLDWSKWPHVTRDGRAEWSQYLHDGANLASATYERWRHHGHSLSMAAKNRRLFWTDKGYLGLGPLQLLPGDILCVFFGSQMLQLLGEIAPGRYEYIGECYVHGLMDGEAMWTINDQKDNSELFVIE